MDSKSNLFILTGAGFSAPYLKSEGERLTTGFLTQLITQPKTCNFWIQKVYPNESITKFQHIFETARKIHQILISAHQEKKLEAEPNFEHIIYLLELLCNYTDQQSFNKRFKKEDVSDFENQHLVDHAIMDTYYGTGTLYDAPVEGDFTSYRFFLNMAITKISDEFSGIQLRVHDVFWLKEFILDVVYEFLPTKNDILLLSNFFHTLLQKKYLQYFSLNYDRLFVETLSHINQNISPIQFFSTFNTGSAEGDIGVIEAKNIFRLIDFTEQRLPNQFPRKNSLFFLHGSVFYSKGLGTFMINLNDRIPNVRNIHFQDTVFNQIRDSQINQDGSFRFNNSMITGMNKDTKFNEEPYSSIFAKCRLDFFNAEEAWVVGYSFIDKHINSILKCLPYKLKKLRIVDYIPYNPNEHIYEQARPFLDKVLNVFKGSFLHKHRHPKFSDFSSRQPVENNVWYYKWDETEVEIDLNGVGNFLERVQKEWEAGK